MQKDIITISSNFYWITQEAREKKHRILKLDATYVLSKDQIRAYHNI